MDYVARLARHLLQGFCLCPAPAADGGRPAGARRRSLTTEPMTALGESPPSAETRSSGRALRPGRWRRSGIIPPPAAERGGSNTPAKGRPTNNLAEARQTASVMDKYGLAQFGPPSFWWSNVAGGMEDPVFPRFSQIYTRRVLDSEYIIGGKNGRELFQKTVFGPLWPNAVRSARSQEVEVRSYTVNGLK